MNDDPSDLDRLLADFERLTAGAPRPAPDAVGRTLGRGVGRLVQAVAAVVVVGVIGVVFVGALALTSPSVGPPTTVDGLPVMTVGQVLDARAAGGLRDQQVAVGGYWSASDIVPPCVAPTTTPGVLEMYCEDGLSGITQRNEPIAVLGSAGVTRASGPYLTPYIPSGVDGLGDLGPSSPVWGAGDGHAPVPIVVVGHFDDPLAADCRPEARQACLDRLVVDKIAYFGADVTVSPTTQPMPTPSPTPTPTTAPTDAATAACSAIIDNIPMVLVASGKPSLAAAYVVTGDALDRYMDVAQAQRLWDPSIWPVAPTAVYDACFFDGDLVTETPGPPSADISAVRVLVVISHTNDWSLGPAILWAIARHDQSLLPLVDPTTISAIPSIVQMPTPTDAAMAACSGSIDAFTSMVTVQSGTPTVVVAYEVTGEQLTRYFTVELGIGYGHTTNLPDWWNNPTKLVDMCIIDGDFYAIPPGGPVSYSETLAVIEDGTLSVQGVLSQKGQLPTTDPATIPASPSASPGS